MEKIIKVKLADLAIAENNVRMHPRRQIEEYKRSLEMFGQTKNAVIDENDIVLIGNGLVMAARELEWDEIYAIRRTDLSENDKLDLLPLAKAPKAPRGKGPGVLKLMISDNKIFGLGIDNRDAIDEIFSKLVGDLDIPGYDETTLNLMIAETSAISEEVAGYGILSSAQIEKIQSQQTSNAPHPQADEQSETQQPTESGNNTLPDHVAEQESPNNYNGDNADMILVASCPNCGGEIWLSKDALRALMS